MSDVLQAVRRHARHRPDATALIGDGATLRYAALAQAVDDVTARLDGRPLGVLVDNGPAWVIIDLAAQASMTPCVPLPGFFSDTQLRHVMEVAGIGQLITDQAARVERLIGRAAASTVDIAGERLACLRRDVDASPLAASIAKVSFTSGTTGQPNGVCLRQSTLDAVTASLCHTLDVGAADRSLCLLPLATLLENIGGVYVPLLAGASACVPGTGGSGMIGAAGVDVARLTATIDRAQPTSMILVPQLLQALVAAMRAGWQAPRSLRFVAVGGAPVAPRLLNEAEWLGLPVYEGYGLSEACSVVCLNRPMQRRLGTVGEVLPHASVTIAADGEIWVGGALFDGYLGEPPRDLERWPTGDIGRLDTDGYLTITGRKKSAYATAFGRNVLPEWVEREMGEEAVIEQIAVFGEARPFNVAVIFSRSPQAFVAQAIERVNATLPDYARVQAFVQADEPFTPHNGELTPGGKLRRAAIRDRYASRMDSHYQERRHVVSR